LLLRTAKFDQNWNSAESQGSPKNKFTISGVAAPGGQGAKTQEYPDIPRFGNAAGRDAGAYKM
jgi:hypothetical protein